MSLKIMRPSRPMNSGVCLRLEFMQPSKVTVQFCFSKT